MDALQDEHRAAACLIVNPRAGGGAAAKLLDGVLASLRAAGWHVDAVFTSGPGDATRLARLAIERGKRCLIAMGGDGTCSHVLAGMMLAQQQQAQPDLAFACLPAGRGNSFLRDFGVKTLPEAVHRLLDGQTRPLDVGRFRCRCDPSSESVAESYFLNVLGVGFVADVCYLANGPLHALGEVGYSAGVLATLARLGTPQTTFVVDGATRVMPSCLAIIANSQFTGGRMRIAPQADTADARFDLVVGGALSRLALLRLFPLVFSGTHLRHPAITVLSGETFRIEPARPARVYADGELPGWTPLDVELLPAAVRLVV
jgi:diacylglycerol kinase (ATP)